MQNLHNPLIYNVEVAGLSRFAQRMLRISNLRPSRLCRDALTAPIFVGGATASLNLEEKQKAAILQWRPWRGWSGWQESNLRPPAPKAAIYR